MASVIKSIMKLILIIKKELNNISKEPAMTRHFI